MGRGIAVERSLATGRGDAVFLGIVAVLAGAGMAFLYSASFGYAQAIGKTADHFFVRQAWAFLPAAFAFAVAAFMPVDVMRRHSALFAFLSLASLFLTFVPGLGITRNGAARWIGVGSVTFQPSELFKPAIVLYAAHLFSKKSARVDDIMNSTLPPLFVTAVGAIVIYAQNDFSTAVLVGAGATVMFWIAEVPITFFLALFSIGLPLGALSVLTSSFRLKRIINFLYPNYSPESIGYQLLGSFKAIRAGGFFGQGLGLGTVKLASVPEVQSDFIFAAWAEEMGFLGVVILMAAWGAFAWRAYRISLLSAAAARPADPGNAMNGYRGRDSAFSGGIDEGTRWRFVSYASFGLASILIMQVLMNVGVASGSVPATGISLPFFSAGGSSLLVTSLMCGLIYNFSRMVEQGPGNGTGDRVRGRVEAMNV
ncbi:MAG: putative peptidoglycan glycosyltransferase FtsW [Spirochaetes bacterium]|nr:putative peptidoglycan glycosyltransferase FtsW [Spirochaetota bacterium]